MTWKFFNNDNKLTREKLNFANGSIGQFYAIKFITITVLGRPERMQNCILLTKSTRQPWIYFRSLARSLLNKEKRDDFTMNSL